MTTGAWAIGIICLACIWVAPFLGARRLVGRFLPAATRSTALLAAVVLALALVTLISELLGSIGEFKRWPMVAVCLLAGPSGAVGGRAPSRGKVQSRPDVATLLAGGLAVVVFARWVIESGISLQSGIAGVDSLQYHLPFAATFAQSGWLSQLHYAWLDPVWTFYPFGSEIFHAIGIEAFGRDVISPVINLGWLGLAMLAGWCCGRRWNAAPLTLALTCVVLSLPVLIESQAGSADNDIVSLALLLSAVALLCTVGETSFGYFSAGVAAGLAAGTTLSALPVVAGLAIGVLLFDRREVPRKRLLGAIGVVVFGGYWYLRDLVRIGNPVPGFKLGPLHLSGPTLPAVSKYGFSVAHYATHGWFWKNYVHPGLHNAFGAVWPLVLLLVVLGVVAAFLKRADPLLRLIGLAAGIAAVVYFFTPTSAYGPRNEPFLFAANLRFLVPSVALFLVVGAELLLGYRPRWIENSIYAYGGPQSVLVGVAAVVGLLTLFGSGGAYHRWAHHPLFVLIGVTAALLATVVALSPRRALRAIAGAILVLTVVFAGLPVAHRYLADRYATDGSIYQWARNVSGAKIGVTAFADQYPLFGLALRNQVSYVGSKGVHGSILLATSCTQWREQLLRGGYDYVVIGDNAWSLAPIPERAWTQNDPAAQAVVTASQDAGPTGFVFRISPGPATNAGC